METIEFKGKTFAVEVKPDDCLREPWKEHDGHGVVSDWTRRDKKPSEKILHEDRYGLKLYYDISETIKRATTDGWGVSEEELLKLEKQLGHKLTKRQIVEHAVHRDFNHLRAWCRGDWYWVYVLVTLLDSDDKKTSYQASLAGIESDSDKYLSDIAEELAQEAYNEAERTGEFVQESDQLRVHMGHKLAIVGIGPDETEIVCQDCNAILHTVENEN